METIDLRSDTVTRLTPEMRASAGGLLVAFGNLDQPGLALEPNSIGTTQGMHPTHWANPRYGTGLQLKRYKDSVEDRVHQLLSSRLKV
jgi:hypothetical protein